MDNSKQAKGKFRVDGPFFKSLVAWMRKVDSEATVTMDSGGLSFAYMDPSHVALAAGKLRPQAFVDYTMVEPGCFAVDLTTC